MAAPAPGVAARLGVRLGTAQAALSGDVNGDCIVSGVRPL